MPSLKILTFFNHAGGVGKTSLTRDVGAELAAAGARVLLIDLDPQANLTGWLGITGVQVQGTAYPVAVEGSDLPEPMRVHGLDLIPSHVDLALAESQMLGQVGAVLFLRQALAKVADQYDVCLIDSPPSLGQLSVMGALAADHLIVPVPTRQKGVDAMPGLQKAMSTYHRLRPDLTVALYVPTFYDSRRLHDQELLAQLRSYLSPLATPVPQREAKWLDSTTAGEPIGVYAPGSPVHQDVQRLTREIAQAVGLPFTVKA
jgi:chromosome partitioning protein